MRFLHESDKEKELTYNDVFLVPQRSDIRSRMDANIAPMGIPGLQIPIMVANMTAAAGKRMAETVARRGGLVILPQDYSLERIEQIVQYVKAAHHIYETPVVLEASESIQTAFNLIYKRSHGAVIVVDAQNKPIGIFTEKDAENHDRHAAIEEAMQRDIVAWKDKGEKEATPDHAREMFTFLSEHRIKLAPVIDENGILIGVITKKGCVRSSMYKPALNQNGELMTAVAVGARTVEEVVPELLRIGVDVIVMDTAHGHQSQMIEAVRKTREICGPEKPIIAGNVVTKEGVEDLANAGASVIKVGVGPGAMCSTRMATGVGRPQFSAVLECSEKAKELGVTVLADGGVRAPRDVALALAAGADNTLVGSWFAGTNESPADILFDEEGRPYKSHHGMASSRAVRNRNKAQDEFTLARRAYFEEGISSSRMYLKKGEEGVEDIIDKICAGVRSAFTYEGALNLAEFHQKAVIGTQSASGYAEGAPVQKW